MDSNENQPNVTDRDANARKIAEANKVLEPETMGLLARKENQPLTQKSLEVMMAERNVRERALDCLVDCLNATRTYYDLFSKTMVTEPDYKARVAAGVKLLAWDVGEPVKRQQILVGVVNSMEELQKKLAANPEMCVVVEKIINEARQGIKGK